MNSLGDCAQTARTVIDRVHRRDDGEKNLRSANVTRRFVATDVLLARLQRKPISGPAFSIVRNTNQSSRHVTLVLIARGEVSGVRSAKSEWNAEPLRISNRNVGAEFARRLYQCERENVCRDDDQRAGVVRLLHKLGVIVNGAVRRRILYERAKNGAVELELRKVVDLDFNSERFRAGANDFDRFRVTIVSNEKVFSI